MTGYQNISIKMYLRCRSKSNQFYRYMSRYVSTDIKIANSLINGSNAVDITNNTSLTWYSCGPTVYDVAHLGHARNYICTDIIRRILSDIFNLNVTFAMGVTDIDDKIIKKASLLNLEGWEGCKKIVRPIEKEFFSDMDELNIKRPDFTLRVSEHLDEIIAYITRIIELDKAYITSDGVYFDLSKCGDTYGKLGIKLSEESTEEDPVDSSHNNFKRDKRDFALWKLTGNHPKEPAWDSPWGRGRPGWHIECSAMTHSLFGKHLTFHSGGVDLKFPHHTNEIAQCEAHNVTQDAWVSHWIHIGHLHIEGRKMSKSLKNFISIRQYLDGSCSSQPAADLRIFFLQHKYSSTLVYSQDRIVEASQFRKKIQNFVYSIDSTLKIIEPLDINHKPSSDSINLSENFNKCKVSIRNALADDFDTPTALKHLSHLIAQTSDYINRINQSITSPHTIELNYNINLLLEIKLYVLFLFITFGLPRNLFDTDNNISLDDKMKNNSIDAILSVRSKFRKIGVHGLKNISALEKKMKSSNTIDINDIQNLKSTYMELLEISDDIRDVLAPKLGIKIEDLSNDISRWAKV